MADEEITSTTTAEVQKECSQNESCPPPIIEDGMSGAASHRSGSDVSNSNPYSCDAADIYTVERVVGKRVNPETGHVEYRIKWKNYPASDNTWEPTKNIYCREVIDQFERLEELKEKKRAEKQKEREERKALQRQNRKLLEQKANLKKGEKENIRASTSKPKKPKRIISAFKDSDTEDEKEKEAAPSVPGYDLGYTLERIIGAAKINNTINYLLKYNEKPRPELVVHTVVGEKFPQELIEYLLNNACWVPN